ncbi:pimeloyl-ACP methyl ester carboxylesterase [Microbacterium endophyticum]|uniref:Pimeloyl-ACP methyl ester carboxylesterase n=1 Tax=Microbacterium endophyticum TaxID=1526412 RepID=A0A7W4V205_9MICO|nr:alpha/beta hydrolase [Microbacterium endophyticum]MBB2975366.1 pimeloyl-ACP methyl ester carboxylesterase [Microbacterium endophyticum]NIK35615.1 pimeloyl-ACP methyl ester carboxylesterase [Microbacterium endophyticum]
MHVVLVHGAGGSPASWSLVTPLLEAEGLTFSVADNPSQSLRDDVERVIEIIEAAGDDILLVGHSYGGAVISNAGRHERVRGLVYIAAFAPDQGESVQDIVTRYPAAEVESFMTRGPNGEWLWGDSPAAREALAWDVPAEVWDRREEDHRESADAIFTDLTGEPAWRDLPAWYLLATRDKHIRVEAQRDMAARAGAYVIEVESSHAVPHAAPARVLDVIVRALAAST